MFVSWNDALGKAPLTKLYKKFEYFTKAKKTPYMI